MSGNCVHRFCFLFSILYKRRKGAQIDDMPRAARHSLREKDRESILVDFNEDKDFGALFWIPSQPILMLVLLLLSLSLLVFLFISLLLLFMLIIKHWIGWFEPFQMPNTAPIYLRD